MKKKISKEELKDILHKEELEKIWAEIPKYDENIRQAEADEKFWKEHLHPYYDEMFAHTPTKAVSDVVRKEIEEYKENDPIFHELDKIEFLGGVIYTSMGLFWLIIGVLFFIGMLTGAGVEDCLEIAGNSC